MQHLGPVDELELGQRGDAMPSSEGWKEKSKLSMVLIGMRRAVRSATPMRRPSRRFNSSASRSSMASMALISPFSSLPSV
jgi:hypothetical protein